MTFNGVTIGSIVGGAFVLIGGCIVLILALLIFGIRKRRNSEYKNNFAVTI